MSETDPTNARVLAIDPISRGFGYAVLEGPDALVDWGICNVTGPYVSATLRRIRELVALYDPDVLVTEDCRDVRSRRRQRARTLIGKVSELATPQMTVRCIPASRLPQLFGGKHSAKKDEVASTIAAHFPELAYRLPPSRKVWQPEDERMSIFDATGLALAFYVTDPEAKS